MGAISDIITELSKLHQKTEGGIKLQAVEVDGIYYTFDENSKPTEHKSLTEIDGSEEWVVQIGKVSGHESNPPRDFQTMALYWELTEKAVSAKDVPEKVYPKIVKTASGKIVHLAGGV